MLSMGSNTTKARPVRLSTWIVGPAAAAKMGAIGELAMCSIQPFPRLDVVAPTIGYVPTSTRDLQSAGVCELLRASSSPSRTGWSSSDSSSPFTANRARALASSLSPPKRFHKRTTPSIPDEMR